MNTVMESGAILLLLFAQFHFSSPNHLAARLINDVIINRFYNPRILPMSEAGDMISVDFYLSLQEILGVNSETRRMSARAWITMTWEDMYLKWDKNHYGDVTQLYLKPREVWTPDVWLINAVDFKLDMEKLATVSHKGDVWWKTTANMAVTCDLEFINTTAIWRCPLEFLSWTYGGSRLILHLVETNGTREDDSNFKENPDFPMLSMNSSMRGDNSTRLDYSLLIEDRSHNVLKRSKLLSRKKRPKKSAPLLFGKGMYTGDEDE